MLDTIEVSCKTKHNIRLLAHFLYDTAFTLKSSGGVGAGPGAGGGGGGGKSLSSNLKS